MSTTTLAKIGGVLLLITMFCAPFSEISIREEGIIEGNPSLTIENVIASYSKFQLACILDIVMVVVEIAMIGVFYALFEKVGRVLSLIASYFRLFFLIFLVVRVIVFLCVQQLLIDAPTYDFSGIYGENHQLSIVSLLFFRIQLYMKDISVIFLALHCMILGVLMYRSKMVPKILGILMIFSSFGYIFAGSAFLIIPSQRETAYSLLMITSLVGDPIFCLYLLSFFCFWKNAEKRS